MSITKFGIGLVVGSWIVFIIFLTLSIAAKQTVPVICTVISGIFSIFNIFFFRDPERNIPRNPDYILSPADGKIIQITRVQESDFFNTQVSRVSIFLSLFNVHINRAPISGKVNFFRYIRGSFLPAFRKDASTENEQTVIGVIDKEDRKVMFTQIAGVVARRIECTLREGYQTNAGDRIGMIRYGSRADVYFLDEAVELRVKLGDKVKGGESIIGVFK